MHKTNNADLLSHAQRYIRSTIAAKLREEGFTSKDNDDIFWYRIKNGDVIQTIYFYTQHPYLPMTLQIGYGCHPLFITPLLSSGPYLRNMPGNEVLYPRYILMSQHNNLCYSEDILVSCPEDKSIAINILNEIFTTLNSVATPVNCYQIHKNWRKKEIENNSWIDVSTNFVDEVVFWEDRDLYPYCEYYIFARERLLQNALLKSPKSKKFSDELCYLQLLKRSIIDGNRDAHLPILKDRERRTIHLLEKHLGIRICEP
jgi:hypothetical protein